MTRAIIEADSLQKRYGDVVAVEALSYEVYPGEIFAILGPNGAGKTTTIRITLGLIRQDGGEVRIFGEPPSERLYPHLGYLPEERGLYQEIPVTRVLVYLAMLKGLERGEARLRAREGLERLGLADVADAPVKALSRGMQQKVQFLATILHDPALVVIDEPFSGLDPVNTRLIEEMIYERAAAGSAVVMSTHQMRQIESMADRLMMISDGRRVLYGPVDEVRRAHASGSVLVRARGEIDALPGVERVERRDGRVELFPAEGVDPRQILRELALDPSIAVEEFEVSTPSLDEIFIAVANQAPA